LLTGSPLILLPVQVLILELIIDPACSIVFERESPATNLMQRPPRPAGEHLFGLRELLTSFGQGFVMLGLVVAVYQFAGSSLALPQEQSAALAFTSLVAGNLGLILLYRSGNGLWQRLRKPNAAFWWVTGFALVVLAMATRVPPVALWFGFSPPPLSAWLAALALPLVLAPALSIFQRRD
jgi:Ca2+-transporting ATPase